jgi:hypothetical protein
LLTQHTGKFEFDFELQWPRRIPLGSQCVKLIGVPMCLPKMFNSMFNGHPNFKLTDGGLIKIGTVIKNYESWAYKTLAVPHSIFTRLPLEVMQKYDIHLYLINNPIYPDECKQQGVQRSLYASSSNAKYGIHRDVTAYYKHDAAWWSTDEPYDSLITLISQYQAERIYKDYTQNRR